MRKNIKAPNYNLGAPLASGLETLIYSFFGSLARSLQKRCRTRNAPNINIQFFWMLVPRRLFWLYMFVTIVFKKYIPEQATRKQVYFNSVHFCSETILGGPVVEP